jgi:exopolyphosphatase/guanosine-5'-triphosphate,3'-diphosphate pyrophosphatase
VSNSTYGAVDLGSNSFHMVIARQSGDDVTVVDRLREPVRLADGLAPDGTISPDAEARALECLERFGQRLRDIPPSQVRAVGTNTMRRARTAHGFRTRAARALNHPIEIISGQEEARLIYFGVANSLPMEAEHRLVVDIGGGSTEVIVGRELEVLRAHSLFMGCVTYSREFFPDGRITKKAFRSAETAAQLEMRGVRELVRQLAWKSAVGASGTIHAASDLLARNRLGGPAITLDGLRGLRAMLIEAESMERVRLDGLKPDRAPVLPGGIAILIGAFKSLDVDSMSTSPGALREGVLYDLIGRLHHRDVRDRAVQRYVDQYHVDVAQAARVGRTAMSLLEHGDLFDENELPRARKLLTWGALLHEIGLAVSFTGYHKHGAYLVENGDLPGFSSDDQRILATLVRWHRRRLSVSSLNEGHDESPALLLHLCVLLRLAVLLNRSRSSRELPEMELRAANAKLTLTIPQKWFEAHALSRADLEREGEYLRSAGVTLEIAAGTVVS